MKLQNFEIKNNEIKQQFLALKKNSPQKLKNRLQLSWSNWGFGMESLKDSAQRLKRHGIKHIELHGNRYGSDLGYDASQVNSILDSLGMEVSGICGMFSAENDLSSNSAVARQRAIDYIKRNVELGYKTGAKYFLIVPGAVGRSQAYDDMEFQRSAGTLRIVSHLFADAHIRGAVEPIRSTEVSFCHQFVHAKQYINAVASQGVQHINGDVYHMLVEESHLGQAIIDARGMLTNLHMADTNRDALGAGFLDLDNIIMALYIIGYNNDEKAFITPEPLGPGGDPYPAMYGKPDLDRLDALVGNTARYFRKREAEVLKM